jgi:hypothetical protein
MTEAAVDAVRVESDRVLDLARSLTPEQWELPSACAGWRVQDVLTHLGAAFQLVADPGSMPDPSDAEGMEAAQEIPVRERRDWSPGQVIAAYEEWREPAIDGFVLLQGEEMAELPVEMGDLGTHPMHLVADAYAFDHYTHLRFDLAAPDGPLPLDDLPRDEVVLGPTVGWLIAGLPQMCVEPLAAAVDRPFGLRLEGPGGGAWTARPTEVGGHAVAVEDGLDDAVAFVATSGTHEFVGWSTTRRPWSDTVTVTGDEAYATLVLDAINLI